MLNSYPPNIHRKKDLQLGAYFPGWALTRIFEYDCPMKATSFVRGGQDIHDLDANIGPDLSFADIKSDIYSGPRCLVCLAGEKQSPNQKHCTDADKESRDPSRVHHTLGGIIHGLRSQVHTLLGFKVVFLTLISFGFAALSGLGAFIVFDDSDREAKRQVIGRMLLLACPLLSGFCLLLGLQ